MNQGIGWKFRMSELWRPKTSPSQADDAVKSVPQFFTVADPDQGAAMALIGYARVSTAERDTALQTDALRKAGCEHVFEDTVSGGQGRPPRPDCHAGLSA